ncbi:MAG: hypothetical protein AAF978_06645, partial [Cyanobacteria bacterium P01_E01_bin.48]
AGAGDGAGDPVNSGVREGGGEDSDWVVGPSDGGGVAIGAASCARVESGHNPTVRLQAIARS